MTVSRREDVLGPLASEVQLRRPPHGTHLLHVRIKVPNGSLYKAFQC